jgi:L-alanine-DL-glutamate epimerase-like enolase superfamily enzyme
MANAKYEELLAHVRTSSNPSELKITDIKICDIAQPYGTSVIKILTNQGLEGYGQVREGCSRIYAVMLKRLLLGENPCNVDKLFRRIKQFGWHSHQGGGVSGIEVALWDLAGKAYGVPIWQMLGGKFRDNIRIYCDTDIHGKHDGTTMGKVLKDRIDTAGYNIVKMDLSANELCFDVPGATTYPTDHFNRGSEAEMKARWESFRALMNNGGADMSKEEKYAAIKARNEVVYRECVPGNQRGIHLTELGLDIMEEYVKQVRDVVGMQVPIATDHFGPISIGSCIQLAKRLEKYNLAWLEDMVPWMQAEDLAEIQRNTTAPLCTGEDIYLKENYKDLFEKKAIQLVHPDVFSVGGIYECKKVGDMAQDYGIQMVIHMNETPIAAMAAANVAAATENFFAQEFHHHDYKDYSDMVVTHDNPIVHDGYITVPQDPGLGILALNDEWLAAHLAPAANGKVWQDTDEWDFWNSRDRIWL